jgi:hypothetical protein
MPTYDVGAHRAASGRGDLLPIFRRHGVDMVFAGHSHGYQRFRPMYAPGENVAHPITFVVTAGGGAPLHRLEMDPYLAAGSFAYHFLVLKVDGDVLEGRAVAEDGTELDSFTIRKPGGRMERAYRRTALPEDGFGRLRALVWPSFRNAFTLSDLPAPDRAGAVTFDLGLTHLVDGRPTPVRKTMAYDIRLESRAAQHYRMTQPVAGRIPAGETAKVTVGITAKRPVEAEPWSGTLWPILRLECVYTIEGQTGSVYSARVRARVPEEPFKTAAAAEMARCDALLANGSMATTEAARRKGQILELLRFAREGVLPVIERGAEGFRLLDAVKDGRDIGERLKALDAEIEARPPPSPPAPRAEEDEW